MRNLIQRFVPDGVALRQEEHYIPWAWVRGQRNHRSLPGAWPPAWHSPLQAADHPALRIHLRYTFGNSRFLNKVAASSHNAVLHACDASSAECHAWLRTVIRASARNDQSQLAVMLAVAQIPSPPPQLAESRSLYGDSVSTRVWELPKAQLLRLPVWLRFCLQPDCGCWRSPGLGQAHLAVYGCCGYQCLLIGALIMNSAHLALTQCLSHAAFVWLGFAGAISLLFRHWSAIEASIQPLGELSDPLIRTPQVRIEVSTSTAPSRIRVSSPCQPVPAR